MSKTVTIGGDRLGTGKKMKQTMHGYERSNHDLSYIWRSTMAPGVLVPFMNKIMLPGDTFDISLNTETLTHPTTGPLFGSFKLQLDVFKVPIRLYQAQLHNNKLGIGLDMSKIKLPQLQITANSVNFEDISVPLDLQQINPSSLLAYQGIRGLGKTSEDGTTIIAKFNAIPYLAYYDIYKNYYANKQEEIGAIVDYSTLPTISITNKYVATSVTGVGTDIIPTTTPLLNGKWVIVKGNNLDENDLRVTDASTGVTSDWNDVFFDTVKTVNDEFVVIAGIVGPAIRPITGHNISDIFVNPEAIATPAPQITTFPLSNLDNMREDILAGIKSTNPIIINETTYAPYGNNLMTADEEASLRIRSYLPMQGLALKTYQSDKFNNWLSTEWIEGTNGIAEITKIDVTDGLNLDTLNLAQKVYNMLNRIAISGGSYYDWIEAVYTESPYNQIETPVYCGGLSKEVIFQEVVSNSESGEQPLGTLAGRGRQSSKHKGGEIYVKAEEPCYAIGIVSLTPRLDYSQGNEWDVNLETMDDFHKPALDGIGFQDLITDEMVTWDTDRDSQIRTFKSAGKQPAWIDYMTDVNKTYGHFADERSEMFMTLNRRYEADPKTRSIKDLTTYIDPAKFNYTFAQTDRSAQNFWVQIKCDISARRKVSARQIPNL